MKVKLKLFCAVMFAFILFGTSTAAFAEMQNPPDGFRGIKFGDPLSKHIATLVPADDWNERNNKHRNFDGKFFRCPKDKMSIGNTKVDDIVYLFCDSRFAATWILTPRNYYKDLVDICVRRWGYPELPKTGITIAQWRNDDVFCSIAFWTSRPDQTSLNIGSMYLKVMSDKSNHSTDF